MSLDERLHALDRVRATLALDCACEPAALDRFETQVTLLHPDTSARRYTQPSDPFVVTMGRGVVIAASQQHESWVTRHLVPMDRERIFSASSVAMLVEYVTSFGLSVYGPDLKYVCTSADLADETAGHDIEILEDADIQQLYVHSGFSNALQYDPDHPQPDVLATVMFDHGEPVGIAGASADTDDLWQIGIDVVASYRGSGIGRSLVRRLTAAILERGRLPYYSTSPSNLASQRLARSVGFWPAWTELRTVDRDDNRDG